MGKYHCLADYFVWIHSCFDYGELKQFYFFDQIQTSQTGGDDTSPNGECSLSDR